MCLYYRSLTGSKNGKGSQKAALSAIYKMISVTESSPITTIMTRGRRRRLMRITIVPPGLCIFQGHSVSVALSTAVRAYSHTLSPPSTKKIHLNLWIIT